MNTSISNDYLAFTQMVLMSSLSFFTRNFVKFKSTKNCTSRFMGRDIQFDDKSYFIKWAAKAFKLNVDSNLKPYTRLLIGISFF